MRAAPSWRSLGVTCSRSKAIRPQGGVVVSNHLSYLDIAIFSAAMKCFFVAKAEISRWPYFGEAARSGGTIFIDRSSVDSAEEVAAEIADRLALPVPILFFPEGTSSDGSSVLRFHSRLFEPAHSARAPVTAAAIRYVPADGTEERDLCWFGDDAFSAPPLEDARHCRVSSRKCASASRRVYSRPPEPPTRPREEVRGDARRAIS